MEMATVADELLLDRQHPQVKAAIQRVYVDSKRAEEIFQKGKQQAFREARINIRDWFKSNDDPDTCSVIQSKIDELIGYIDT